MIYDNLIITFYQSQLDMTLRLRKYSQTLGNNAHENAGNSDWLIQTNQSLSLAEENNVLQAGEGKLPGAKLDKQCKVLEQKELFCQ